MYRIHKSGDNRCLRNIAHSPVILSDLVYESANFECPSCGKVFKSSKMLQEHIDNEYAEENSRSSLTLQSV